MCLLTGIGFTTVCVFGGVFSLKVGRTNSIRRYWHEWCRMCVSTFVYHLQLVCRLFVLSIIYLFSVSLIFVCSLFASEFFFFIRPSIFLSIFFYYLFFPSSVFSHLHNVDSNLHCSRHFLFRLLTKVFPEAACRVLFPFSDTGLNFIPRQDFAQRC